MKWLYLTLILLCLSACSKNKGKLIKIEGRVTQAGTGMPIEDVTVSITEDDELLFLGTVSGLSKTVRTNKDGFYSISGEAERNGRFTLAFNSPGFLDTLSTTECAYVLNEVYNADNSYNVDVQLFKDISVNIDFDSLRAFNFDSIYAYVANKNIIGDIETNKEQVCFFCYPGGVIEGSDTAFIADSYCFEQANVKLELSLSNSSEISNFYSSFRFISVLSNFENTISIKAYNSGAEVYNKSVTYNFESNESTKTINF